MYCSNCGMQLKMDTNFCFKCGAQVSHLHKEVSSTLVANAEAPYNQNTHRNVEYAGFWERVAATLIDAVLWVVFSISIAFLPINTNYYSLIGFFIAWMYYALLDSSSWQGTIGKKLLNIKVCDLNGNRISFLRATMRYFMHILSYITMLIGYLMVVFTGKKQALHDMITRSVVLRRT